MRFVLSFTRKRLLDGVYASFRDVVSASQMASRAVRDFWKSERGQRCLFNLALLNLAISCLAIASLPAIFYLLLSDRQPHLRTTLSQSHRHKAAWIVGSAHLTYVVWGVFNLWIVIRRSRRSQRSLTKAAVGIKWRLAHAQAKLERRARRLDFVLVQDGSELELVEVTDDSVDLSDLSDKLDALDDLQGSETSPFIF
ncbi:MAG: hypothetical protein KVP17_003300 [Porospora cf. gigantea B]|uniref:uncharacterized protein n=1 Tax=Porospora cf. gigantea B TaxID=2853592 RepID=UPI00357196A2|nr:MAG: hypothetical protein KVP17_003300 [Porospora cf. gigantea B]